jgi:RNA polymerase sigma factor (sigma-70 family)
VSFETIYRRYHQDLYRYCLAILGNREDAQDALQNTMIKAMRALQGEKRQIKLKPWLYRIAHNESIDMLRRRRPTKEINVDLAATGPGAAEAAETRERLRRLIADLNELPDRQRGALVMRELSGLSFEQIGAALATSGAVARQTVYEARLSLREMEEGREMSCEHVMHTLSNADGRIVRRRDIRAHLRACPSCRRFRDDIAARRHELASLAPLPAVAAAGLLQGILGAGAGGSGAGLAGSVGAGAGKAVATSAVAKSAATVAVVAAVGGGAADRGGLVDVPLLPSDKSETRQAVQPASATEPTSTEARLTPAVKREIRLRRREQAGGNAKAVSASGQAGSLAATPASEVSPDTGTTPGHGPPDGLPAASSHGQQTAAVHRSDHGNRSKGQSQSKTQGKKSKGQNKKPPAPQAKSNAPGPRPDRSPPVVVGPDKTPTTPLYPSNSTNQGAP